MEDEVTNLISQIIQKIYELTHASFLEAIWSGSHGSSLFWENAIRYDVVLMFPWGQHKFKIIAFNMSTE